MRDHDSDPLPGRLTAVMIRGDTELRVRADEAMSCVCIEMDGTPYRVVLGVTPTGADNLRTMLDTGLADLAARQQMNIDDSDQAATDG